MPSIEGLVDARGQGYFAKLRDEQPWHLVKNGKSLCGLPRHYWPYREQGRLGESQVCQRCLFVLRLKGEQSNERHRAGSA